MHPTHFIKNLHLIALSILPLCAADGFASDGEAIRFFYTVKQEVFEVTEFSDGLPAFERNGSKEGLEPTAEGRWRVTGALPMEFGWASPITNYQVRIVEPSYRERDQGKRVEVDLDIEAIRDAHQWESSADGDFLVVAWIVEGVPVDYFVTDFDASYRYLSVAKLRMAIDHLGGNPLIWRVSDGRILTRSNPQDWEAMAFQTEPFGSEIYARWAKRRDSRRQTAAHYAAANGWHAHLLGLTEANRRLIRAEDEMGSGLLRMAVTGGRTGAVELLLAADAPTHDRNWRKNTLIHLATETGNLEILKALAPTRIGAGRRADERSSALANALEHNREAHVLHLLNVGAAIAAKDERRLTYSQFADGYPMVGFLLLEHFQLDGSISDDGSNLLHIVAPYADSELLERVRNLGANIAELNKDELSPMDVAVGLGNVEAICWFIENGGRREDGEGVDPLRYAIEKGKAESVECLIDYGYRVDLEFEAGATPVMLAASSGRMDIARVLLEVGSRWKLDSPFMAQVWTRILQLDAGDVAESILQQGWRPERAVALDLDLWQAVSFYGAGSVGEALHSIAGEREFEMYHKVENLDHPIEHTATINPNYPKELQAKYGNLDLNVDVIVDRAGSVAAWKPQGVLGEELLRLVDDDLRQLSFSPATIAGKPVPVLHSVSVSFKATFDVDEVFTLAQVDEIPKVLRIAEPEYPRNQLLEGRRVPGWVVVECVLDVNGRPQDVKAVSSSNPGFERSAIASVRGSIYRPAHLNGVPVRIRIRVPIEFKM